jgi:hypothetical protein
LGEKMNFFRKYKDSFGIFYKKEWILLGGLQKKGLSLLVQRANTSFLNWNPDFCGTAD